MQPVPVTSSTYPLFVPEQDETMMRSMQLFENVM